MIRVQSDWPTDVEGVPSPISGPAEGDNFGEFAVIEQVAGNTVVLDRPLRRAVEDNAEIAVFEYTEDLIIRDMTWTLAPVDGTPSYMWSRYTRMSDGGERERRDSEHGAHLCGGPKDTNGETGCGQLEEGLGESSFIMRIPFDRSMRQKATVMVGILTLFGC